MAKSANWKLKHSEAVGQLRTRIAEGLAKKPTENGRCKSRGFDPFFSIFVYVLSFSFSFFFLFFVGGEGRGAFGGLE